MPKKENSKKAKYYLDKNGEFIIENYNFAKPFANFFPGIAGKYGIPMWVFYVNRGQAIASFGTKDKDHSYLEFFSANKAWQNVSYRGFRTFIKVRDAKKGIFYEPFHNGFTSLEFNLANKMSITSHDLKLAEENLTLGIETRVEYFTIPHEPYAALVRTVTVRNTGKKTKNLQVIDGLPQVIPYATANLFLKKLNRTIEAWMNVKNLEKGVPFYKLDVDPTDRPEIIHVIEGNFYLGFEGDKKTSSIIRPIVDPQAVFGPVTDFSCPYEFVTQKDYKFPKGEITTSKTPSALLLLDMKLSAGEEKTFYGIAGYMRNLDMLNSSVPKITASGYLARKKEENKTLIAELQSDIETVSSSEAFNLYAKQTYLDNVLRGGYPLTFKSGSSFYLYSRKHGDLERDYNKFLIQASYFSQGNGNYRDANQNRRSDTWFNPDIKDENIITFFNLLQTDGFNPLVVKGAIFSLNNKPGFKAALRELAAEDSAAKIMSCLEKPFTPGEVIICLEENKINLKTSYDEFLDILISHSAKVQEAEHGEGFWTDHWTYNLDLLESYLGVYPEKLKEILFDKKVFTFYDNTEMVKPRKEKYCLVEGVVKQLHSLSADGAKKELIRKRHDQPHVTRAMYGQGEIYYTTLTGKILNLIVNKLASLDPFGMGMEMEANKPNWYDALNGLPGLFGSSLNETLELKRLIIFITGAINKTGVKKISLTQETHDFLFALEKLLEDWLHNDSLEKDYEYWDKSYSLKEDYRQKTRMGLSGKEIDLSTDALTAILEKAQDKLDAGINKAKDQKCNIYYAYFIHEVTGYKPLKMPLVKPVKFAQKRLPLFLEAQVHALKLTQNSGQAKAIYNATRTSPLYDKQLKMYKVTASLKSMPEEIGRCRVFAPGWLEHESIWLHMEYKYLLEILKLGLYEEFYQDFKNCLIPFQKPQQYGRSILENSSFLVSSAFPDKSLHGNGFVARLSGSTAEFLQIWLLMNLGNNPFRLNEKDELTFRLAPALAGWLFTARDKTYSFNFLSKIRITYHNPERKDTFGKNAASPQRIAFNDKDGNPVEISSDTIPAPYAEQIRSREIRQINVYLA